MFYLTLSNSNEFILIYFLDINEKARVRFNDVGEACIVPYDGTPFIILARYERNCIYGKDKHKKKKKEEREKRESLLKASCIYTCM